MLPSSRSNSFAALSEKQNGAQPDGFAKARKRKARKLSDRRITGDAAQVAEPPLLSRLSMGPTGTDGTLKDEGNGLRRPPQRSNSDAGAAAEAAASSRLGRGFNGAAEPPATGPPKQRSPQRLAVGPPAGLERFGSPSRTLKQAVSCTEEHLRKSGLPAAERPFSSSATIAEDPPQSFATYLKAELAPEPSWPTADAVWGQTERDRVYNALIFVPYQLERLLWYGLLLCLDSFLAIFTILPIRAVLALQTLLMLSAGGGKAERQLSADQLYDLICVAIFGAAMLILYSLDVGVLYFWIKDLTQEFLKLHVIYTAVEIFDKIFCSFGIDCLEALSGTCTMYLSRRSSRRKRLRQLLCDSGVAFLVVLLHGGVIMCQGMAFSVAMNSKRGNALVALLIAANFVEIKGTVLKRFDSSKLFKLTCSDIVERFHLLVSLSFVLVEDMDNSGRWVPNAELLRRCAYVFAAEVVIDIIKHAVLGKFNEIRPGVYREFMKDVCENVKSSQSHNVHRIVEFEPIGPAALSLRIFMTYCAVRGSQQARAGWQHELLRLAGCLLLWVAISVLRAALGFLLKYLATLYTHHYQHAFQKSGRNPRTNLSTKQT